MSHLEKYKVVVVKKDGSVCNRMVSHSMTAYEVYRKHMSRASTDYAAIYYKKEPLERYYKAQ